MAHLDDVHLLHSFPEVDRYNTLGIPSNLEDTRVVMNGWLQRQNMWPASGHVFYISSGENFIGLMGINLGKPAYRIAEVWYKLHPAYWGKGFATEALSALLMFGFDTLELHRIEAGCAVENIASKRVLEKSGMKLEGIKRGILPLRGEWADNYFFSILENEFNSNK
jgi:ribosomal-protein-alanine N-acetyltransferase